MADNSGDRAAARAGASPAAGPPGEVARLMAIFASFYVLQALCDSEGLVSLPITAMFDSWGWKAGKITTFFALVGFPWLVKPLFGLLTDYVPVAGYHRKVYLIASGGVATAAYAIAAATPLDPSAAGLLFGVLLASSLATAFSDVVIDAMMVETGQPRGLTGRFQSVQWTAIYAASVVGAEVGGRLSGRQLERAVLAIAAALALASTLMAILFVREKPRTRAAGGLGARLARSPLAALRRPGIWAAAAFLLLWNFNPLSSRIVQLHMRGPLSLGDAFYGDCEAVGSAAAMLGSLAYGYYCRRISPAWLVRGSIVLGVAATLVYLPLSGPRSAMLASAASGFANGTGVLMLLDLAARLCPIEAAGTLFALLMGVSNLGSSASQSLGGIWLDAWRDRLGGEAAFQALVITSALFTAACWLLAPILIRALAAVSADRTP